MSIDTYAAHVRAIRTADSVEELDELAVSVERAYPEDLDAALLLDLIAKKRARVVVHAL
jgi:hypothetical protein